MTEAICQRVVLAARPQSRPKLSDLRLEKVEPRAIQEGEILLSTKYLSLDPYMRGRMDDRKSYSAPTPIGAAMEGEVVARVSETRHPGFRVGEIVAAPGLGQPCYFRWERAHET